MATKKQFKFYNIEERYRELKILVADLLGFGVDLEGFLYDQETMELLKFKNKYINIDIESDEYRNVAPLSLMNPRLFAALFNIFSKQIEEDGIYIRSFSEEYTKPDEFNVNKSRLVLQMANGFTYFTDWYYIPALKFIDMMTRIADFGRDHNFSSYDSYEVPKLYNIRAQEVTDHLAKARSKKERKSYDFQ